MKVSNVELLRPQYVDNFKCIGPACENTCCAGWKITIDEDTYKKYRRVKDYRLSAKLSKYIIKERSNKSADVAAKIKQIDSKCPFLTPDCLCNIQQVLGEDYLSNTCAIYPRIFHRINGVLEESLTLSCIEAARIALGSTEPLQFIQDIQSIPVRPNMIVTEIDCNSPTSSLDTYFWELRIFIISTLQNRNYTINERLLTLGLFINKIQQLCDTNNYTQIPEVIAHYTHLVDSGMLKSQSFQITSNLSIPFALAELLNRLKDDPVFVNTYYNNLLSKVLEGIQVNPNGNFEDMYCSYKERYEKYYLPFESKYEYILENYLVNNAFHKLIPLSEASPLDSMLHFVFEYITIKLHLIGLCLYMKDEALTDTIAIETISSVVKQYHHGLFINSLLSELTLSPDNKLTNYMILLCSI